MARLNKTKKNLNSLLHINYKSLPKRNRLSMPWVVSTAAASRAGLEIFSVFHSDNEC